MIASDATVMLATMKTDPNDPALGKMMFLFSTSGSMIGDMVIAFSSPVFFSCK